jgi:large subunit ribosomal protein L3
MKGLIGKKIGMTNVFDDYAKNVAVTVVEVDPCVITQVKTVETDGYEAIQVAAFDAREKSVHIAQKGEFAKAGVSSKKVIREFRNADFGDVKVGDSISVEDVLKTDDLVTVTGTTKGKGFTGVIKRHNFSGVGGATHGQHNRLRAPGSIGQASDPSRVFPGTRMAGHSGNDRKTITGLKVVRVLPESNLVLIKGAIPGANGSIVTIKKGNR